MIVARHCCEVLGLSVEIGHHKLGHTLGIEHVPLQLLASVSGWRAWNVEQVRSKSVWFLPVCVNATGALSDWVFVRVFLDAEAVHGSKLGSGCKLVVEVADPARRRQLAERLVKNVMTLLRGRVVANLEAEGARWDFVAAPAAEKRQTILVVLGLVMWHVAALADVEERLLLNSPRFVTDVRLVAAQAFATMRDRSLELGGTDVLIALRDAARCRDLLRTFGTPPPSLDGSEKTVVVKSVRVAARQQRTGSFEPWKFLTWNVAAALAPGKAARSPPS